MLTWIADSEEESISAVVGVRRREHRTVSFCFSIGAGLGTNAHFLLQVRLSCPSIEDSHHVKMVDYDSSRPCSRESYELARPGTIPNGDVVNDGSTMK